MSRPRRVRYALPTLIVVLALGLAFGFARPQLETSIRARIESEAARRGLRAQVETVHVGIWPPLRLKGVRLEKAGVGSALADSVDVTLRLSGSGLVGRTRIAVGTLHAIGPAGIIGHLGPSSLDVLALSPTEFRAGLREQPTASTSGWHPDTEPRNPPLLDVRAVSGTLRFDAAPESTEFELDLIGHDVRIAALTGAEWSLEPEFGEPTDVALQLSGSWRTAEGDLGLSRWRVVLDGATTVSGALSVTAARTDPRIDLSLEVASADFARLFRSSGVALSDAVAPRDAASTREGGLGALSLTARVKGRLAEPASFEVSQRLDFTPPPRLPAALTRLRGDFEHEVALPDGRRRTFAVAVDSPDFVALGDVPPLFVRALLIAEDAGFFGHRGIDLAEVPSAILTNWARGGAARGASTISQQLAKNLFLSREKRLGRKLQELWLAMLLESTLSKQRILEIYLNVIEWGPDLYGLRPAARHYFGKEPAELTPAQVAFLVALVPAPVKYQRSFGDGTPGGGLRRLVDELLAKLRSVDALSEEQYQAALAEELFILSPNP